MSVALRANELLTIQQVAEQIGVHQETLRRWEKAGVIPPAIRFRGQRRYPPDAVERIRAAVFSVPGQPAERRSE